MVRVMIRLKLSSNTRIVLRGLAKIIVYVLVYITLNFIIFRLPCILGFVPMDVLYGIGFYAFPISIEDFYDSNCAKIFF